MVKQRDSLLRTTARNAVFPLLLATLCSCAGAEMVPAGGAAAATRVVSTAAVMEGLRAAAASGALAAEVKRLSVLSVPEYLAVTMSYGHAGKLAFGGMEVDTQKLHDQLASFAALADQYASMGAYWRSLGINPAVLDEARYQLGMQQIAAAAQGARRGSKAQKTTLALDAVTRIPGYGHVCNVVEAGLTACPYASATNGAIAAISGGAPPGPAGNSLIHSGSAAVGQEPVDSTLGHGSTPPLVGTSQTNQTALGSETGSPSTLLSVGDLGYLQSVCTNSQVANNLVKCP